MGIFICAGLSPFTYQYFRKSYYSFYFRFVKLQNKNIKRSEHLMAEKAFVNTTGVTLQITLFIRKGENPVNQDGTSSNTLDPGETKTIFYGGAQNIFLNGLEMFTILNGDLYSKIQFVTIRESELDDLLNTNNVITITKGQTDYVISGSNPFLDAVNNAQTVSEVRTAIENLLLELDFSSFNNLSEAQKDQVADTLLTG
jgi:hypothetical protein